ncbi:hypothetical protein M3A96_11670, partial [Helcobacillus massiliensis]|uniref:hypothetical protein n=1 Tax=Helcobacillus massiliensis TaxID=521392 RepID=UPI0021A3094C
MFYLVAPQGGEREMNFFRVLLREITEEVDWRSRSVWLRSRCRDLTGSGQLSRLEGLLRSGPPIVIGGEVRVRKLFDISIVCLFIDAKVFWQRINFLVDFFGQLNA